MAFQFSTDPQHVKHPDLGWLDADPTGWQHEGHPELDVLEGELGAAFQGGPMDPTKFYDVEVDCSTGMQAWQEQ